jgi:hypothetical protein
MTQEGLHPLTRFTKEFQDEAVRLTLTSGRSRREGAQVSGWLVDPATLDRPPP